MTQPFRYDIRNQEVMKDLLDQGFTLHYTGIGFWTMESPSDISHTKARKVISWCLKMHLCAKKLQRAQRAYEKAVYRIDNFNLTR